MEEQQDQLPPTFDKALAAVTDLIIAVVRSGLPSRFEEAKALCAIAQGIVQAKGRIVVTPKQEAPALPAAAPERGEVNERQQMMAAVANVARAERQLDLQNNDGQFELVDTENGGRVRRGVRQPGRILFDDQGRLVDENGIAFTGALDSNSLMRHMLMAFGPHAQTGAEANRAKVAREEAEELDTLAGLIAGGVTDPEKSVIERRIKQLMANMERRSNANPPDPEKAPVVPPDDQRGHPPDAGGGEADDPACVRADDLGDGGDGAPPQPGAQHVVGADAVV